jgi:hypothetical protein
MGNKIGKLRSHISIKMAYCEILHKRGGPNAPSAIQGPLGPILYQIDKANISADGLEDQFTQHDLCDYEHKRQVEARVHALLVTVDEDTHL